MSGGATSGSLTGQFEIEVGDSFTYDDTGTSSSTKHQEGNSVGTSVNLATMLLDSTTTLHYTAESNEHVTWSAYAVGQLNYHGIAITGNLSFSSDSTSTYQDEGDATRTIHELGSSNNGAVNLSCMVLKEDTDSTFTLQSEATTTYSGDVAGELDIVIGTLNGSFHASGSNTEELDATGTHHEHLYQAGQRQGNTLNLESIVNDTSEEMTYTHSQSGNSEMSGDAGGTIEILGGTVTGSIEGSSSDSFTYEETGTASKSKHEAGSQANNTINLNCVVFVENSNNTFEEDRTSTSSWNGVLIGNVNILSATINGEFGAGGTETETSSTEGSRTESQYQAGKFNGAKYNLTSVVFDESSETSYSRQISGESQNNGSFSGNVELGGANLNGSYSASGTESYTTDLEGESAIIVHKEGSYANDRLSLTCIVLDEHGNDSETTDLVGQSNYSGFISGSYVGEGIGLFASYSASGSESHTEHHESESVHTLFETGAFQNGSMSLETIVYTSAETTSFNAHDSGSSNYSGTLSGSITIVVEANGSFNATGSETYSNDVSGQATSTLFQKGTFASGELHLSSVVLDETTHGHFEHHQSGQTDYTGTISGSIGSAANGLTGYYAASGNESYSYDEEGTTTIVLHQAGQSDVGVLSLSSVSYDESNSGSFTDVRSGGTNYDGGIQGSLTVGGSGLNGEFTADGNLSFTRAEQGTTTSDRYEAGTYADNSFNLSSIVFDETESSTITYHETGSDNYEGQVNGSFSLPVGGLNGDFEVSGNETWVADQTSVATRTVHESGTATGTNLSLSCVVYHSTNNATTTSSVTGSTSYGGSINGSVALGAGSLSGNYSMTVIENYNRSDAGIESETLHQEGVYANGSYSLSCVVFDSSSTDTFTAHKDGLTASSGNLTGGLNFGPTVATANFSFTKGETWTYDSNGVETENKHLGGAVINGSLSLTSVVFDEASTSSYTYGANGSSTWEGWLLLLCGVTAVAAVASILWNSRRTRRGAGLLADVRDECRP